LAKCAHFPIHKAALSSNGRIPSNDASKAVFNLFFEQPCQACQGLSVLNWKKAASHVHPEPSSTQQPFHRNGNEGVGWKILLQRTTCAQLLASLFRASHSKYRNKAPHPTTRVTDLTLTKGYCTNSRYPSKKNFPQLLSD
jgi:hypothetical protein